MDIPRANKALDTILEVVADVAGSNEQQIRQKGRKGNKARDLAIYLARNLSGKSCMELGNYFGGILGLAVTLRYNHVAFDMKHNKN